MFFSCTAPPSEIDYFLEKGRKEDSPVNRPVFTVKNKFVNLLYNN